MGSAKTAMLLTTAYNFEERGMGYVCYKPIVDTREARSVIRSRIGIERACRWINPETDMYDEISQLMHTHPNPPGWVLVDEAQFMSEAQVDQLARVVDDFGINVLCYGLRHTPLRRQPAPVRDCRHHRRDKIHMLLRPQDHRQCAHRLARQHNHRRTAGGDWRQRTLHGRVPRVLAQQEDSRPQTRKPTLR
jgi:hypothetical protein